MNAKQIIETFLHQLVSIETTKVLPFFGTLLPGVPGQLLGRLLADPSVQAKLAGYENWAIDTAVEFMAKEVDTFKGWVATHTGKGPLHDVIQAALNLNPPGAAHLTADQVREIAVLSAAGQLNAALTQGLELLGFPKAL